MAIKPVPGSGILDGFSVNVRAHTTIFASSKTSNLSRGRLECLKLPSLLRILSPFLLQGAAVQ